MTNLLFYHFSNPRLACLLMFLAVLVTGCSLISQAPTAAPPTDAPRTAGAWHDAADVIAGICFDSALDAAGDVFVLRSEDDLQSFFDLADHSQLCRRPVRRMPYDFSEGQVLVGTWSVGRGCTAEHDITDITQDDSAQTMTIRAHFSTQGECPYELVRPFWVGISDAAAYDITLMIEE